MGGGPPHWGVGDEGLTFVKPSLPLFLDDFFGRERDPVFTLFLFVCLCFRSLSSSCVALFLLSLLGPVGSFTTLSHILL